MSSDNVRKLGRDPAAAHVFAKRTYSTGTLDTTQFFQSTGNTVATTSATTVTTFTVTSPSQVLFTTGTLSAKGTTGVTATLTRDGTTVANTDNGGTGTSNTTFNNTHTTPLIGPQYKLKGKVTATNTTGTVTVTLTRENQWSGTL